MGRLKKAFKLAGIAALAAIALLLLAYSLPFGGWKAMSVQTGSMRPAIEPGDLVLVDRVPVTSLKVGDVITYVNQQNQKQTITHRIVAINGPQITVKGDANSSLDPVVFANNVVGKVQTNVPYLGHAVDFIRTPIGLLTLIYVPALIIVIGEIRRLAKYYRDRQPYVSPILLSRLQRGKSAMKKRVGMAAVLVMVLSIAALGIAWPVQALFSSQATLTGNTISTAFPPPGQQCPPGGNSNNTNVNITGSGTNNTNNVTVNSSNNQTASSGNATVSGNTTGGNATSGNASNTNCTNVNININNGP